MMDAKSTTSLESQVVSGVYLNYLQHPRLVISDFNYLNFVNSFRDHLHARCETSHQYLLQLCNYKQCKLNKYERGIIEHAKRDNEDNVK